MSEYDRLLEEAKKQGSNLAKNYVPELYRCLVDGEKLDPRDAGDRIKKDLALIWSLTTINKNLPEEAKHREKDHSNNDIEESVKPVSQIILEHSTSGTTSTSEPNPEPRKNDKEFGMGVVSMSNDDDDNPEHEKPQPVRIIISGDKFVGLIKLMNKFVQENGRDLNYVIEYNPVDRDLYVDLAEQGEERSIDD